MASPIQVHFQPETSSGYPSPSFSSPSPSQWGNAPWRTSEPSARPRAATGIKRAERAMSLPALSLSIEPLRNRRSPPATSSSSKNTSRTSSSTMTASNPEFELNGLYLVAFSDPLPTGGTALSWALVYCPSADYLVRYSLVRAASSGAEGSAGPGWVKRKERFVVTNRAKLLLVYVLALPGDGLAQDTVEHAYSEVRPATAGGNTPTPLGWVEKLLWHDLVVRLQAQGAFHLAISGECTRWWAELEEDARGALQARAIFDRIRHAEPEAGDGGGERWAPRYMIAPRRL